jgi:dTDP-4-amino-4,6-dideoxygalactose transaminase
MSLKRREIGFANLAESYRELSDEVLAAARKVLEGGRYILGAEVEAFEGEFAKYIGARYCVGCGNGTEALALALVALDVGPGHEVVTVANTAAPTALAICMVGARPVFVDVDPQTLLIDPVAAGEAITPRTRAIVPVHLYGLAADMEPVLALSGELGIPIVEDCAQAHGAEYRGKRVGSIGRLGCFSFYPTKNLGAYGDGGAITTNDELLYRKLLVLRNCGLADDGYRHSLRGLNSRLDELHAAMLRVKLPHLHRWNARRRDLADLYRKELGGRNLVVPGDTTSSRHAYHLFVVRARHRDRLREHLRVNGVQTLIHYPIPLHLEEAFAGGRGRPGSLPKAEKAAGEVLSLPLHPHLSEDEVLYVAETVTRFDE